MWIRKLWKSGGLTKRYSRASCRDVLCAVTETAMAYFALTSGESAMRASRKPWIDRSSFAKAVLAATADAKMKIRLRLTARKFVDMAKCGFASIDQNSSHKIDKGRDVTAQYENRLSSLLHSVDLHLLNRFTAGAGSERRKTETIHLRVAPRAAAVFGCSLDGPGQSCN